MKHIRKLFLILAFLLTGVSTVMAQTGCAEIVDRAITISDAFCSDVDRNQVCYGHTRIEASPTEEAASTFFFNSPGHVANIETVEQMSLVELNEQRNEWGVAHLRLQANIPGTVPGQHVTVLAFGSVDITNPSPTAFTFSSGIGEPQCAAAPNGILVRTPAGVGNIELTVNRVLVSLGSTAFLQAAPSQAMSISLLEGSGEVIAEDQRQPIFVGSTVSIPMTNSLGPGGPPGTPQIFDQTMVGDLPLGLLDMLSGQSSSGAQPPPQVSQEPCRIVAQPGAEIRVGPGTNRTVFRLADGGEQYDVTGQNTTQGSLWWQIDKSAVPGSAMVNELWIRDDHGQTTGNCETVGGAAPPPIVPIPQAPVETEEPAPQPIGTDEPAPPPTGPPVIGFTADQTSIYAGDCVTFTIVAQNIDSVYFFDPMVGVEQGLGVQGTRYETRCFRSYGTYTYQLRVLLLDGSQEFRSITIDVMYQYIG